MLSAENKFLITCPMWEVGLQHRVEGEGGGGSIVLERDKDIRLDIGNGSGQRA
jgi:hypothetical protein